MILVVALVVLGPSRLPDAGRQVGRAVAEVRRWSRGFQEEVHSAFEAVDEPQPPDASPVTAVAAAPADAAGEEAPAEPPAPTPGDLAPDERAD